MLGHFTHITLQVSSNLANALNFLLFDIFLLSVIFHLTADVSGRLNDASLRAGHQQRLHISCPPLIGGGLSGTSFWRALLLMGLRVLAFAIVFATNLTITGSSVPVIARRNATVAALGSLENMTHAEYISAKMLRESCVGTTNTSVYYGELRDGKICNTDLSLISTPVYFSKRHVNATFNVTGCAWTTTLSNPGVQHYSVARCKNALLQCSTQQKRADGTKPRRCRGIVHVNHNMSFVCQLGNMDEGVNPNSTCFRAYNLAFMSEFWLEGVKFGFPWIFDIIDATYGAGREVRTVQYFKNHLQTKISPLWFVAFALKVTFVLALLCTSLVLRRSGYHCRVHDERQLSNLLRENLGQISSSEDSVYLNAVECDRGVSVWASAQSGLRERNHSRHMEEALHY